MGNMFIVEVEVKRKKYSTENLWNHLRGTHTHPLTERGTELGKREGE